jgi:hypothetical protein
MRAESSPLHPFAETVRLLTEQDDRVNPAFRAMQSEVVQDAVIAFCDDPGFQDALHEVFALVVLMVHSSHGRRQGLEILLAIADAQHEADVLEFSSLQRSVVAVSTAAQHLWMHLSGDQNETTSRGDLLGIPALLRQVPAELLAAGSMQSSFEHAI